ncbi:MAG: 5'/3'-nucleotidase SurE, partial [Novosphingobium sp.]
SGAGHSLTLNRPVRLHQHAERRFSVTGTPTDSITLALKHLMPDAPDLILSGVNRGANLGDDVTYSGTVAAAIEGALAGVPSIALSQVYVRDGAGEDVLFDAAEAWGAKVIGGLIDAEFAPRTLININFPPLPAADVKGIRVARQGFHDYGRGSVVKGTDPRGNPYYWFGLYGIEHTPGHETDLEAIADGYVSVTPLQLDLTHQASLAMLKARFA